VAAASAEASPVASGAPSAEDKKKKRKPASLEAAAECLTDENAIADIRSRQDELDLRQKELDSRAAEVDSKERALADQLKKIEAARDEIKKVEELRSKEQGSKVGKVVETFETMTPKSVSSMLSAMDENLAVEAINRMTTPKLAKVLNLMEPSKSSRLTELLVGMRAKVESKSSVPPSGAERSPSSQLEAGAEKTASEKGGE
jgi:flagellar motility protein MotE (MotC chaperone)